jgi:ribosomal protein S18 acetylase RimI-like enzyme
MTPKPSVVVVRRLKREDLPAVLAVQSESYPAFLVESEESFASRLDAAAPYCLAATLNGALVGYLIAHGWRSQSPPVLGALLARDPPNEILFVHDLAVGSAGRGLGIGRKLVAQAFQVAAGNGLHTAELVAVEGAASYWRALGFAEATTSPALASRLAEYGADARLMTRTIA